MKPILKKIATVISILAVGFGLLLLSVAVKEWWDGYTQQKRTDAWQAKLEQPYKEDTYGGKTPEETWAMFLDALKKGDVKLASKYFGIENREKDKKVLEQWKLNGELAAVIRDMEKLRRSNNQPLGKDEVYYSFDFFDKEYEQELTERVIFSRNFYTQVWKITLF